MDFCGRPPQPLKTLYVAAPHFRNKFHANIQKVVSTFSPYSGRHVAGHSSQAQWHKPTNRIKFQQLYPIIVWAWHRVLFFQTDCRKDSNFRSNRITRIHARRRIGVLGEFFGGKLLMPFRWTFVTSAKTSGSESRCGGVLK